MTGPWAGLAAAAMLSLQPATHSSSDETLSHVQELYESASYEQALDALSRLQPTDTPSPQTQEAVSRYRVLCLVALDRNADAERVVADMVRNNPTTPPLQGDLSPRVETLVTQVRQRVTRGILKDAYEQGRDFYERGQFAEAADRLGVVVSLVNDPALGFKSDPSLADLRLLADGFLKLAKAAATPLPAAKNPPADSQSSPTPAVEPVFVPPSATAATSGSHGAPRSAGTSHPGFVPPRPIAQPIPRLDQAIAGYPNRREGEIEIEVGVDGTVVSAAVRVPTNATYDALLVATAKRDWKFEPATRLGVPVPYRMRIKYVLAGR